MTGEPERETEEYVKNNGMAHGYAYDKKRELSRWFGVRGIPNAVLIGPNREILWRGHPAALKESMIEATLEAAIDVPMWKWPSQADGLAKAIAKEDWTQALEEAAELDRAEVGSFQPMVRTIVDGKLRHMERMREEGDYLSAIVAAKSAERSLKGLPEGDRAKEIRKELEADKQVKVVVKAQEALQKLMDVELKTKRDADDLIEKLEDLAAKHPDTYVVTEVKAFLEELELIRRSLRK